MVGSRNILENIVIYFGSFQIIQYRYIEIIEIDKRITWRQRSIEITKILFISIFGNINK